MTRSAIIVCALTGAALSAPPALAGSTPACVAGAQSSATECGVGSVASNTGSTAVGVVAQSTGRSGTALGVGALTSGDQSTALGAASVASASLTVAVGVGAQATVSQASALGYNAQATAVSATALGHNAAATFGGSTALGAGAAATRAQQVVLGAAGTSVTIGDIGASTAAQSGAVSTVTVDANGTLGRDNATLPGLIGGQAALFDLANTVNVQAQRGIAAAAAVTTAPLPSAPGRVSYAANGSVYRGQFAFGASAAYRFDTARPFALTGGVGVAGKGDTVGRVGVAGEF